MNVIERLKEHQRKHQRLHVCTLCDRFLEDLIKELEEAE